MMSAWACRVLPQRLLWGGVAVLFFCGLHWSVADAGSSVPITQGKAGSLRLLFSGRRHGVLEPCGCSLNQEGGLQFEAALARQQGVDGGLRLEAGEWAQVRPELYPLDALKARTMLRALQTLGFDAINVGWPDLQLGRNFFKPFLAKDSPGQSGLVSANIFLTSEPLRRAFAPFRVIRREGVGGRALTIGITGITGKPAATSQTLNVFDRSGGYVVEDPVRSLRPVVAELRPRVDMLIVLCAGELPLTREIARVFPGIDWLITTAPPRSIPYDSLPDDEARILCVKSDAGRQLGVASLALSGGKRWRVAGAPEWIPVRAQAAPDPEILKLLNEFKRATREIEVPLPGAGIRATWAGAQRCAPCHRQMDAQWASTPHARAVRTLTERDQLFNPDCTRCHTTGYRRDNGFYSAKHPASQAMLNVQCEACHGPALQHAEEQEQIIGGIAIQMTPEAYGEFQKQARRDLPRREVPETVCRDCHDAAHDPQFAYREKVKKVGHGGMK